MMCRSNFHCGDGNRKYNAKRILLYVVFMDLEKVCDSEVECILGDSENLWCRKIT